MATVRRWYVYLICAISLNAVVWAIIYLLRNTLATTGRPPVEAVALQTAIIIVGLPIYLVHWFTAQRLSASHEIERDSALRKLYLYGVLTGLLAPFLVNLYYFIAWLFQRLFNLKTVDIAVLKPGVHHAVPMGVLALVWLYHSMVIREEAANVPVTGMPASIRRLYIFLFSAAGLFVTALSAVHLLRWLLYQFGPQPGNWIQLQSYPAGDAIRILIGLPLWLIFWRKAQKLFFGEEVEEKTSGLRKFYLYGTIFYAVMTVVSNTVIILAGVLRGLMSLPSQGSWHEPLPLIVIAALVWAYHASVLREDAQEALEEPEQAGIRRLYLYLVAGIGLLASLIGLGGLISVLILSLSGRGVVSSSPGMLAWFTAALMVGLPVWLLPWREAQNTAAGEGAASEEARRSVVRKIYLYVFLFIATMTVLSGMVFIVFRAVSMLMGESAPTTSQLGQAIAYSLIGVGVWLYHGSILRKDNWFARQAKAGQIDSLKVVLLDFDGSRSIKAAEAGIRREAPGADLQIFHIRKTGVAPAAGFHAEAELEIREAISQAGVIAAPLDLFLLGAGGGETGTAISGAAEPGALPIAGLLANSPARKLLLPVSVPGWDLVGVETSRVEELAKQTGKAVHQIASGEVVRPSRPLGAGAVVGIILAVFFLIGLVPSLLSLLLGGF